jgi:hypothetical protein
VRIIKAEVTSIGQQVTGTLPNQPSRMMSFTSSKLIKQEGEESPIPATVEQLSEPLAGGSNGAEISARLSRDVRRIERLRQHSSIVIRRIDLGIEAMRSNICGSSLVDTQVWTPVIAKEVT